MRLVTIAAAAVFLAGAVISGQAMAASAGQSKMQQCAAQWQDMKKSGQDKGTTYKAFSSTCMKGASTPAPTPAPAAVVKMVAPAPTTGQSKMQQCAASWQQLKSQNKTNGMDYKTYSSSCMKGTTTVAMATPATSMAKPAVTKTTTTNMSTPSGKMPQQDRMKACAAQWDQMKAQNKTNGMTYKQWSSQCLKTH